MGESLKDSHPFLSLIEENVQIYIVKGIELSSVVGGVSSFPNLRHLEVRMYDH